MGIALRRYRCPAWAGRALLGLIGSLASSVASVAWPGVAWGAVEVRGASTNVDVRKLDGLVALELGEHAASIDVVVTIADDASSAELVVRDAALSAERQSVVDLSGVTDIERIVALSVGELARSELPPPPPAPPPAPPPVPPAVPDVAEPAPSAPSRAAYGVVEFGVRRMLSGGANVVMPRLEGGFSLTPVWRVGAFAYYGHASSEDALGSISVDMAGAGLAGSFDFLRTERLTMGTGPRIELGWMWGRGEGEGGSTSSTPTFAATWQVQAFTRIVRSAGILAALDVGFAGPALDLHANGASDRSVLDLAGLYTGLSLGIGILSARPR